jgi:Fe-S-cluster containining protein
MHQRNRNLSLVDRYPPSEPCSCEICTAYCIRPGWWTVEEAARALDAGYGPHMMLEISPEHTFGVLSPAFKGCECQFALQEYARAGCTFLANGLCELHESGLEPLECRFCHHTRVGMGPQCHAALEKDWKTLVGQALVEKWAKNTQLWQAYRQIVGRNKTLKSPPPTI